MISINAPVFDPDGSLTFQELGGDSDIDTAFRRVARVATLDGGVSIEDRGFSEGDRTFTVVAQYSARLDASIKRMHRLYPFVNVTTREGTFRASIQTVISGPTDISLTLLIKDKI